MKTNGFIVAVDAFLGLIILFSVLAIAFSLSGNPNTELSRVVILSNFASSAGKTLEQSRLLSNAVISDNTSAIRSYFNSWPYGYCGSILVRNNPDSNEAVFVVSRSGCGNNTGVSVKVEQGFIVSSPPDSNLYVADIMVWVEQ